MEKSLIRIVFALWLLIPAKTYSQKPKVLTSGEIYENLEKLNVLASVLYVAAHPDDENTRLISYLANHKKAETTYLSLTRGDGGQNLIGKEIDEYLGVLRTQELLMARSVDNGKQRFSRANDFGFSKNAEETIEIWDAEKIKADVTFAIRNCRPDIIINRFDHRTSGETHGHHTASAMLSLEMFDKTGNASVFPEQMQYTKPWQARRIFFNTSWWFYGSQEKFEKADKSMLMGFDVGTFFPLLGKSNTEISAESRSKHKCQGFGSTGTRGSQMEYLELLKGDMPKNKQDVFDGIDITWNRVKGGEKIKPLVERAIQTYDFRHPEKSLPVLLEIYSLINRVEDPYWKSLKSEECKKLIEACSGLFLEAKSLTQTSTPGENISLDIEIVKRLPSNAEVVKMYSTFFNLDTTLGIKLEDNEKVFYTKKVKIPAQAGYTTPYWLWNQGSLGMYEVPDLQWVGLPETPTRAEVVFEIRIGETIIPFVKNVVYKFNSPEEGELYRPFSIVPPVGVNFSEEVFLFPANTPEIIKVVVTNNGDSTSGILQLPFPEGWQCEPEIYNFALQGKGISREFSFTITPPSKSQEIIVSPVVQIGNKKYHDAIVPIKYDHIPHQLVQQKSEAKCIKLDINTTPASIGYIEGAGDVIAEYLQKTGYQVTIIPENQVKLDYLKKFDCIVTGVRAYNTMESLKFKTNDLMQYVEEGGKLVVQYNTSNGLVTKNIGPYPFKISRDRVTVENAEMRLINPNHRFLNYPNKLTNRDFEGWVQERGLYFATEWDEKYETIFSCNDPGETPKEGALIVASYGQGEFVYTGISFFRQFPAGVAGAYRLFSNIITPEPKKKLP